MIMVNIDVVMAKRKISAGELAERIRFSTVEAICRELDCQVSEVLEYVPDKE